MQSNYDLFLRHLIDNSSRLHGIKIKITRASKWANYRSLIAKTEEENKLEDYDIG